MWKTGLRIAVNILSKCMHFKKALLRNELEVHVLCISETGSILDLSWLSGTDLDVLDILCISVNRFIYFEIHTFYSSITTAQKRRMWDLVQARLVICLQFCQSLPFFIKQH